MTGHCPCTHAWVSRAPALKIDQVLRKPSAGSLHACNDAAQASRLGEAAAVIVKGVRNVLLADGGHAPKRWRARRVPADIDPQSFGHESWHLVGG